VCVFVQLLGGTFGALLLKWSTPGTMVGSLGTHDLANGIYGGQGLLLEMVLTFVLVFVIFGVAVDRRGPGYQSTTSSKNQYYYNLWVDFSSIYTLLISKGYPSLILRTTQHGTHPQFWNLPYMMPPSDLHFTTSKPFQE